jgi:hypothetical protein
MRSLRVTLRLAASTDGGPVRRLQRSLTLRDRRR